MSVAPAAASSTMFAPTRSPIMYTSPGLRRAFSHPESAPQTEIFRNALSFLRESAEGTPARKKYTREEQNDAAQRIQTAFRTKRLFSDRVSGPIQECHPSFKNREMVISLCRIVNDLLRSPTAWGNWIPVDSISWTTAKGPNGERVEKCEPLILVRQYGEITWECEGKNLRISSSGVGFSNGRFVALTHQKDFKIDEEDLEKKIEICLYQNRHPQSDNSTTTKEFAKKIFDARARGGCINSHIGDLGKLWICIDPHSRRVSMIVPKVWPLGWGSHTFITGGYHLRFSMPRSPVRPSCESTLVAIRHSLDEEESPESFYCFRGEQIHRDLVKEGVPPGVYLVEVPDLLEQAKRVQPLYDMTLKELMNDDTRIRVSGGERKVRREEMLECIQDVIRTLKWLHEKKKITHRDLKNRNVFVCRQKDHAGRLRLIGYLGDFDYTKRGFGFDELLFVNDFYVWDICASKINVATPYVDRHGVAIMLLEHCRENMKDYKFLGNLRNKIFEKFSTRSVDDICVPLERDILERIKSEVMALFSPQSNPGLSLAISTFVEVCYESCCLHRILRVPLPGSQPKLGWWKMITHDRVVEGMKELSRRFDGNLHDMNRLLRLAEELKNPKYNVSVPQTVAAAAGAAGAAAAAAAAAATAALPAQSAATDVWMEEVDKP